MPCGATHKGKKKRNGEKILMMGYFDCPAGLESPSGARKRRKATVQKRRNPQLWNLPLILRFNQHLKEICGKALTRIKI